MLEKENYEIMYKENSFYDRLTQDEQKIFLAHIIAIKHKTWIHKLLHASKLRRKPTGRKQKERGPIKPGRPYH